MRDRFELAAGSVGGRLHRDRGLNNQDAFRILEADDHLIAVVCDGCSGGGYSEVGARLGPDLVIPSVVQTLRDWGPDDGRLASLSFWNVVRGTALRRLGRLIATLDGPLAETIERYFLFTVVGVVLTPEEACFFSVGDGVYAVNGEVIQLGPYPEEKPPYLAYGLLDGLPDDRSAWQIGHCLPTDELDSFLLGSDGVTDLMEAGETGATYPKASKGPIGPFAALWENDGYYKNSDRLRRHLALANRDVSKPDWENQRVERRQGLLPDDTTVIVGRRAKPQTERG